MPMMYAGLKTTADQYGVVPVSIPGAPHDLMLEGWQATAEELERWLETDVMQLTAMHVAEVYYC